MSEHKLTNIILVGRTGNGKSASGNTILGRVVFKRGYHSVNEIDQVDSAKGEACDLAVQVIDATGIGDSVDDINVSLEQTVNYVNGRLSRHEGDASNVLVVVLKFGIRFTDQEKKAVRQIKRLFGENCIRDFGIVLMTYGDMFEGDETEFRSWCHCQQGDFRALYDECRERCVLINNVTMETKKKQQQLEHFVLFVKEIRDSSRGKYLKIENIGEQLHLIQHISISSGNITDNINKLNERVKATENISNISKTQLKDIKDVWNEIIKRSETEDRSSHVYSDLVILKSNIDSLDQKYQRKQHILWYYKLSGIFLLLLIGSIIFFSFALRDNF